MTTSQTAALLALIATATPARAQPQESALAQAKRLYKEGITKYQNNEWAAALDALRESARLHPIPLTWLNIGLCERSLGHYVRARRAFEECSHALEENPKGLTTGEIQELHELLTTSERSVAYADVTVEPATVSIIVDGRPLERATSADKTMLLYADMRPPGAPEPVPAQKFSIMIDPGARLIKISGEGFKDYSLSEMFTAGTRREITLHTDRLPVKLSVASDQPGAVASISGTTLGTLVKAVPVTVEGDPGSYTVEVAKPGFVPFRDHLELKPGDQPKLLARLNHYKPPVYKRWWFWTAAVAIVGAAVGLSVGLTASPPPFDGGSSGWVAHTQH